MPHPNWPACIQSTRLFADLVRQGHAWFVAMAKHWHGRKSVVTGRTGSAGTRHQHGASPTKKLNVTIPYRLSSEGWYLLVGSTGIKMLGEDEWKRKKAWYRLSATMAQSPHRIDVNTLEICAIEVISDQQFSG